MGFEVRLPERRVGSSRTCRACLAPSSVGGWAGRGFRHADGVTPRALIRRGAQETFVDILDGRQVNVGRRRLKKRWIAEARATGLRHFVRAANTIEAHLDGVLAYTRTRFTNARTEGLNGEFRAITRRSFGFHDAHALLALIHLCCGGVHVTPAFSGANVGP